MEAAAFIAFFTMSSLAWLRSWWHDWLTVSSAVSRRWLNPLLAGRESSSNNEWAAGELTCPCITRSVSTPGAKERAVTGLMCGRRGLAWMGGKRERLSANHLRVKRCVLGFRISLEHGHGFQCR
ncbi:hypothetical protein GGI35DRAFT_462208 [Trichoderma velutinum]